MELSELQQRVDTWIKEYGVRYFSELTNMAVLTEEVGELARVMARKYGEQSVKAGEKVRADDLTTVANLEMEFASYEISTDYAGISVGDKLVFGTDGLLAKSADVTGYKVYFEVTKKTAYMGKGVLVVVRVQ